MPDTPHAHLLLTVRTAQGVSPAALLIALAVGQGSDDLDRPSDDALHRSHGLLNEAFELGKRLGRLHAVVAYPLEAFGKRMRHHTPDKRVDCHRFPLDPLALVGPIMIRDLVSIVAVDAPERDRWAHHLCGQGGRQALVA
jgi:hypothetical protein